MLPVEEAFFDLIVDKGFSTLDQNNFSISRRILSARELEKVSRFRAMNNSHDLLLPDKKYLKNILASTLTNRDNWQIFLRLLRLKRSSLISEDTPSNFLTPLGFRYNCSLRIREIVRGRNIFEYFNLQKCRLNGIVFKELQQLPSFNRSSISIDHTFWIFEGPFPIQRYTRKQRKEKHEEENEKGKYTTPLDVLI